MKTEQLKDIIDDLIYEAVIGKNPFKVGDLVKLRPDVLGRHARSVPAHAGYTKNEFSWRDTLKKLQDKEGKISRVSPDSKHVNVEYPESWTSHDEYGRNYTVNTIGIDYTELIPAGKPVTESILGMLAPKGQGVEFEARQLIAKYNQRKINRATLQQGIERLMWKSKTVDPSRFPMLKATLDKMKAKKPEPLFKLKDQTNEQFGGYVSDKDMKKDPKHIPGERWRIKFQSSGDLKKHGTTEKSSVKENIKISDIKETIQDLIREMWIGWEEEEEGKKVDEGDKNQHITINIVDKVKKKVVKEIEHPEKNYIIWAKSGPVTVYFVDSPSQGPRMVQNAQSMATRFPSEEIVRDKIIQLKQKYPGIQKWDYEIVGPKSWESVWKIHGPKEFQLGHQVFRPVKKGDEYVVRWTTDGKGNEGRTYYTNDKKDAYDTYALMVRQAKDLNKKI